MGERFGEPPAERVEPSSGETGATTPVVGAPAVPFNWARGHERLSPASATNHAGDRPAPEGPDPEPRASWWGRGWLLVAVVAALIGAAVGSGVTALATSSGSARPVTTIKEGSAAPGPAVVDGAGIPALVQRVLPAVVSIDVKTPTQEDEGTGMIVSPNGMVVTNFHVVALAAEAGGRITVTEAGSTRAIPAKLIGANQDDDVALLQIDGASGLRTVIFGDSTKAVVGDAVVAIGNALGLSQGSPTVTSGIVSAIGRTVTVSGGTTGPETLSDLIQTDAAINAGNSGGPLIDSAGQVIGMNTAVAGTTSAGTNAQNIGFAIPSAEIEALLPSLEKGTNSVRSPGYMGVDVATLTPLLRTEYGFFPSQGAIVIGVVPGGPADQAGLALDDVIVAIDSTPIASFSELQQAVQSHQAGQTVTVTYYRGTVRRTTSVTLVSKSAIQSLEAQAGSGVFAP